MGVDIGPALHEQPGHRVLTLVGGEQQSRAAVAVGGVHGRSVVEQRLHRRDVAPPRGVEKRFLGTGGPGLGGGRGRRESETELLDRERLQAFFDAAQARYSSDLWRYKGVLNIDKVHQRVVIQGVQGLLQQNYGGNWRPFEKRENLLVFIGRALDGESLLQQLRDCELRTHA